METIKIFFAKRTKAVYLGLAAAVLSLAATLVYAFGFGMKTPQFFNAWVIVLAVIGIAAYITLLLFEPTARFSGAAALIIPIGTLPMFSPYVSY